LSLIGFAIVTWLVWPDDAMRWRMMGATVVGIVLAGLMVYITEYYQEPILSRCNMWFQRVKPLVTAPTLLLVWVCRWSTAWPVLAVCAAILTSYGFSGLYGIAIAATAMLSMAGIIVMRWMHMARLQITLVVSLKCQKCLLQLGHYRSAGCGW
jgi:K(+)-stimulated pyrophosphate-energized sodium pump